MKSPIRWLVFLLLGCLALSACGGDSDGAYGTEVKFREGRKIRFPDFVLEYTGQSRETSERYPRGFLFYDFTAKSARDSVTVRWTSGTGLIAPKTFSFDGTQYSLELKHSDKLGKLEEDELVVWRE